MRIFLTGASGFIGSNLVTTLLQQGCQVIALAHSQDALHKINGINRQVHLIKGDLARIGLIKNELKKFMPDTCIHLAWYTKPGEYLSSSINVNYLKQSLDLFDVLEKIGCKNVLMAGTCAEYDTDVSPLKENSPTNPKSLYAASKLALLLVGQQIARQKGLRFAWARIFFLFGPHESEERLIPSLIQALEKNSSFMTTGGEQVRDYLYVKDVTSALWTIANSGSEGIFNICSSDPVRQKDLILKTARLMDREELIEFGAIPYRAWEPMCILGDNQKLVKLGWEAEHSIEEGLGKTVDWWLCK